MSLPEAVIRALEHLGGAPALVVDGQTLSGDVFLSRAAARSQQLADAGVAAGDAVLIANGRRGDFWIDVLAVWAFGAVYAPVDETVPVEFAAVLTEAAFILGPGGPAAPEALASPVALGETPGAGPEDVPAVRPRAAYSLSTILFTSGSTGKPKGVMLTDVGILANADATRAVLDLGPGDRLFMPVPFRFVSALSHFVVSMLSGATLVATEESLSPAAFATRFDETGATCIGGSPIHARWVADADVDSFGALRWIMSSGDDLGKSVIKRLADTRPGVGVYTFYGLTELAGRFCFLAPGDQKTHGGRVGRPIPGFGLRVLDPDGRPAAPGRPGDVHADGPGLMLGYMNDPEATAQVLTADGFLTGDIGEVDDGGVLRLSGRSDDVFKVMGQKVSSLIIVDAVLASGLVADAAVCAVDDPVVGQVPALFYVSHADRTFSRGAMMRELRERLDARSLPRRFIAVDDIPRTRSGKVDRGRLAFLAGKTSRGHS